jgi:spore coat protein A, manganese oxidase
MANGVSGRFKRTTRTRSNAASLYAISLLLLLLAGARSAYAQSPPFEGTPLIKQDPLDGDTCVPKFAVSLPVFGPAGSVPRVDAATHRKLTVTMKEIDQAVLPQGYSGPCQIKFRKTRVWTYETKDSDTGEMLGPANWPAVTIVTKRGTATRVKYVNDLPSFNPRNPDGPGLVQGLLLFDQTLHWADPLHSMGHSMAQASGSPTTENANSTLANWRPFIGPVPATVHLHGGEIPAAFDGDPESWFTPNGLKGPDYQSIGNPGPGEAIYEYPNLQEAGTLWIHDHALGITRINVYAGLAGFYFLRDPEREPKGYPSGSHEIELAIQDRLFDKKSQLYFPQQQLVLDHPFWSVIFEGDVATVNGAAFPYLDVEPRRYRFHLLDGSNHRGYDFFFGGAPIYVIGADANLFDKPAPVNDVPLSPGERTDIIVDFSKFAGQKIVVTNTAGGMKYDLKNIMQFRVASRAKGPDTSCDPANPSPAIGVCARKEQFVHLTDGKGNVLPGVKIDKKRELTFYDYVLPAKDGPDPTTIKEYANSTNWNGLESPSIAHDFPDDGVSERPRMGSIELWEVAFLSQMPMAAHPFHIHLAQFQILSRQRMKNAPDYITQWEGSFGNFTEVPLPSSCADGPGHFCPDYGPPLRYTKLNDDGAVGGNPAFGSQFKDCTDDAPCPSSPPESGELGWKDTADVHGGEVLRILVRWTPSDVALTPGRSYAGKNFYDFDPTQGYYVWHCHVLNHEDNEMMRPYKVTK